MENQTNEGKRLSIRIDQADFDELEKLAKENNTTISQLVRGYIKNALNNQENCKPIKSENACAIPTIQEPLKNEVQLHRYLIKKLVEDVERMQNEIAELNQSLEKNL